MKKIREPLRDAERGPPAACYVGEVAGGRAWGWKWTAVDKEQGAGSDADDEDREEPRHSPSNESAEPTRASHSTSAPKRAFGEPITQAGTRC